MGNLKERIKKLIVQKGGNLKNFKFKYYNESPYMKKRFKPEFVQSECWVYVDGNKNGYMITEDDFNSITYSETFIDMILAENSKKLKA